MVLLSRYLIRLFQPINLHRVLIAHNFICSAWGLYCFVCMAIAVWQYGSLMFFFSKESTGGLMLHTMMVYWLSKIFELMDTVYMLLRHKLRQMSFLHVWHHATITILADYVYHHAQWPAICFILSLNSLIHVVMYGYYCLTALYPLHEFTWKKNITQMQVAQFVLVICQAVYGYLYHGFCVYSILYGALFLGLFGNFYYHAFVLKPRREMKSKTK